MGDLTSYNEVQFLSGGACLYRVEACGHSDIGDVLAATDVQVLEVGAEKDEGQQTWR